MLTRNILILAIAAAAAVPAAAQDSAAPQTMTRDQMAKNVDSRFAAIDTNKDGFLSKDEIAAIQTKVLAEAQAERAQKLETEFKKLDTDKNGSLSLAEFKLAAGPVRASDTPDQIITAIDANKDGKITAAEYRTRPLADFDRLDVNHDGTLTVAEVSAGNR